MLGFRTSLIFVALPVLATVGCAPVSEGPSPIAVEPPSARQGVSQDVTIKGSRFTPAYSVSFVNESRSNVDTRFLARLGDIGLLEVAYVDSKTLTATVPGTLPVGDFDLI